MSLEYLLHQMSNPSTLSWRTETYDIALARQLVEADRTAFIAKLVETARQGDTRAILTLAHMGATEALPDLEADAKSTKAWAGTARRALVVMGYGPDVLDKIAHDAVHSPVMLARAAAVLDLTKVGGPMSIVALQEALEDEDDKVRTLAWKGLMEALGLARCLQSPDGQAELTTEVEVLSVLLVSNLRPLVKLGADGVRQIVRRLGSGATPNELGVAWRPRTSEELFDRLREALFEPEQEFPVDELAQMTGAPRMLAEAMIALRLEHRDHRVPQALIDLDAAWLVPALEELATSPALDAELRDKVSRAASDLRAS